MKLKATTIKASEESKEMERLLAMADFKQAPKEGDLITGKIISVGKNEVLLDIDGLTTGVVRGYERYDESGEYSNLKVGEEVSATVVDLENEKGQIELSFRYAGHIKAWEKLKKLLDEEEIVEVEITDANKGGLMIKFGNIAGFLPVSQLAPEHYPRVEGGNKGKILEKLHSFVGKKMKVKIITADEEEEKMIVSEKETVKEEQEKAVSKYKVGDKVEGKISGVVNFGAFVEFDDGLEGLVHISELAWQRIDDPREVIRPGERVKAEIIDIDNSKISLSIKKLLEDPWTGVEKRYKIGQIVEGLVLKVNPFGLFVELDTDIHGLAHISELSNKPIQSALEIAKPGDKVKFKIITIEPKNHRLGLSIRALSAGNDKTKGEEPIEKEEKGGGDKEIKKKEIKKLRDDGDEAVKKSKSDETKNNVDNEKTKKQESEKEEKGGGDKEIKKKSHPAGGHPLGENKEIKNADDEKSAVNKVNKVNKIVNKEEGGEVKKSESDGAKKDKREDKEIKKKEIGDEKRERRKEKGEKRKEK